MKILLAEDDQSIQIIAKLALEKIGGHQVTIVSNGYEVLEKVEAENFDLIILDGMMPKLDGFETCQRLKLNPVTNTIPVIFMTAKSQQADIDEGFKAGASGYIIKPFDAQNLCVEINKIYSTLLWSQAA